MTAKKPEEAKVELIDLKELQAPAEEVVEFAPDPVKKIALLIESQDLSTVEKMFNGAGQRDVKAFIQRYKNEKPKTDTTTALGYFSALLPYDPQVKVLAQRIYDKIHGQVDDDYIVNAANVAALLEPLGDYDPVARMVDGFYKGPARPAEIKLPSRKTSLDDLVDAMCGPKEDATK